MMSSEKSCLNALVRVFIFRGRPLIILCKTTCVFLLLNFTNYDNLGLLLVKTFLRF